MPVAASSNAAQGARSVSVLLPPIGFSKTVTVIGRAVGLLALAVALLCVWNNPAASPMQPVSVETSASAMHAERAGEGETPRPSGELENLVKKRRMHLDQMLRANASPLWSLVFTAKIFLPDEADSWRLETMAQHAHLQFRFAYGLRLSDPAMRLHPSHAPPAGHPGIAG